MVHIDALISAYMNTEYVCITISKKINTGLPYARKIAQYNLLLSRTIVLYV
jgi:hypothetical protein